MQGEDGRNCFWPVTPVARRPEVQKPSAASDIEVDQVVIAAAVQPQPQVVTTFEHLCACATGLGRRHFRHLFDVARRDDRDDFASDDLAPRRNSAQRSYCGVCPAAGGEAGVSVTRN